MKRASERRPYTVSRYRNIPMDHIVALLTGGDEDYSVEFHSRIRRRREQQ